ncbi:MAG: GDSL-type esterase/lipase family protein [Chloroflexota bacterium]|nr:GDSL-type esterase/lipase family protein [Chloroflexota bacterium]
MPNRFWMIVWLVLAAGAILLLLTADAVAPFEDWRFLFAGIIALITLAGTLPTRARVMIAMPLRLLRTLPNVYWLSILIVISIGIGLWLEPYQPTYGRALKTIEYAYILSLLWLLAGLLAYDLDGERGATMAARLGKSRLTGVSILLTTFVILFFAAEAYLRIFYITTDSYGFTAMNYHWYANFYWGKFNSLGFRDYEPKPDPDGVLTRIAVVGDSFVVGHGIPDLDQSFPQMLERDLGSDTDVLVIADSGWDSDVETSRLDQYPIRPNIVILSYYLNDVDYLLQDPAASPDANFDFIENETLAWFVLQFFVPNYIYYNLVQFSSPIRARNFITDLVDAHLDDSLWQRHTPNLRAIVDWTRQHDARLIVLVWPHLAAIEATRPATARVRAFFEDAGVEVVDMTDILTGQNPSDLIVNRFDAHPGIAAHRFAADALAAQILETQLETQIEEAGS